MRKTASMKKILTLSVILAFALNLAGQKVVLTRQTHALQPGGINEMKIASYVDPGPAGDNQVWDLSAMKEEKDFKGEIFTAMDHDPELHFSSANVVLREQGNQFYFCLEDDALRACGMKTASGKTRMEFDRPYIKMVYPFAYGDAVGGEYGGYYFYGDKQADVNGNYRVEADGHGKLILPGGKVVENVLRVVDTRSYEIALGSLPHYNEILTYRWYTAGQRYPVAVLISTTSTACGQGNTSYQAAFRVPESKKATLAQELPGPEHNLKIYPNPVEDLFTVDYHLAAESRVLLELYDNTGKKIRTLEKGLKQAGTHNNTYRAAEYTLHPGLYFIRSQVGEARQSTPFILQE
jgi:hypothetical protein